MDTEKIWAPDGIRTHDPPCSRSDALTSEWVGLANRISQSHSPSQATHLGLTVSHSHINSKKCLTHEGASNQPTYANASLCHCHCVLLWLILYISLYFLYNINISGIGWFIIILVWNFIVCQQRKHGQMVINEPKYLVSTYLMHILEPMHPIPQPWLTQKSAIE